MSTYIADICIQLIVVERELAEPEVDIGVGIARIEHTRLDKRRTRIKEERELALSDPDTAASDLRDGNVFCVAGMAERDGAVLGQVRSYLSGVLGEVEVLAIGFEETALAIVLDGDTGDVGVDVAQIAVIL